MGFNDSTFNNVLDIPTPEGKAYYRDENPFNVEIEFLPAKTFILDNCNYETNKAILLPEAYPVLDELVEYLNRKDDERIEIGGHTDNVGGAAANLKLSMNRALSVRQYLIEKGIDPSRLVANGYGFRFPIASNNTKEGRAQNRRTEVKIL
jgi:outer membrane protein OmpA-like peptidoglycan-associated protein